VFDDAVPRQPSPAHKLADRLDHSVGATEMQRHMADSVVQPSFASDFGAEQCL
jgi:hypothetical protein